MKFQTQNLAEITAPASVNDSNDPFFAEPSDHATVNRHATLDAMTRLLAWLSDSVNYSQLGIRATIALYCLRPELSNPNAITQLAGMSPDSGPDVCCLVKHFGKNVTA